MKRGVSIILISLIFISLIGIVSAACTNSNQTIMKLSSATNAHGALWNDTDYTYDICYSGTAPANPHDCKEGNTNAVLWLNSTNNSHASATQSANYNISVCYGDLDCRTVVDPTACANDEKTIVRLYNETNSHISNSSDTNYKIKRCCKADVSVASNAKWQDMENNDISSANLSDTVKLVLNKESIQGKEINYTIYKNIAFWFDKKIAQSSGKGFTTWAASEAGTYYFIARVDSEEKKSEDLVINNTYDNTMPSVYIIKPVSGSNYTINSTAGNTGNIPFEQIAIDPDDDLDLSWNFGDGNTTTIQNIQTTGNGNINHSYNISEYGIKIISAKVTEKRDAKQTAINYTHIFIFREGLNAIAILSSPPMDGSLITTDLKINIDAEKSYANNCSSSQIPHCNGKSCYNITDSFEPTKLLWCYNLDKNNFLFQWKFYDSEGKQEGNTLFGKYNEIVPVSGGKYSKFNYTFQKPGTHRIIFTPGYRLG